MIEFSFNRLAMISNQAFSIINFRGDLIREIVDRGIAVYAFAPDYDEPLEEEVRKLGAIPVRCPIDRVGLNPLMALKTIRNMADLFKSLGVDAVFSYFAKPVIYAGLAARLTGVRYIYSLIEGAGYVYSDVGSSSLGRVLLRWLVSALYRVSLRFSTRVFLLNADDYRLFVDGGLVDSKKVLLLPGIGLDLDRFRAELPVVSPVMFVFVGRLLREKGIFDFITAARMVKRQHPQVEFVVVGDADANPDSIRREEIQKWENDGVVRWVGQVDDVRTWLARASVLVLPSYYREGLPRSIQEAMALGRPVITTDWVGCRESIEADVNGFLVPVRSPSSIASAMERFILDPQLIVSMGWESRRIAEVRFNVHEINRKLMACM
ncbi:glycosyltransferase family 4 protein [Pseudomonas schmalbachii]|uniref:Glycosyltransferase family 4 protein n=1 Tax=Pseudomonas schmalbachii TaxID=2816993 RepID=A0ABS3TN57_9PSED|nr:glycosyltransferase family 4 protein [Pseudomonas schmalbachii]MBO3274588.1 glycosyltransferase family 4 protein [Pseudomonas schmalbachii]